MKIVASMESTRRSTSASLNYQRDFMTYITCHRRLTLVGTRGTLIAGNVDDYQVRFINC